MSNKIALKQATFLAVQKYYTHPPEKCPLGITFWLKGYAWHSAPIKHAILATDISDKLPPLSTLSDHYPDFV